MEHPDPEVGAAGPGGVEAIGVVGAGAMGRGIAQVAAQAGFAVHLHDQSQPACEQAVAEIGAAFDRLAAKGRLDAGAAQAARERIRIARDLDAFRDCPLVVEAIVERLEAKEALLQALEARVPAQAVLASNTSSLSITRLAAACRHPGRVIGWHFFNPVPLMRVVEVIPGLRTDPAVVERLRAVSVRLGHRPVVARDTPGFIVNHAGRAYVTEALKMLQESVAAPAEVDAILRDVAGFRLGPFELLDLTGLDVSHPVMESIHAQFYGDPRYRPSYLAAGRVAAGLLGRKRGEGFHRYDAAGARVAPEPVEPPGAPPADAAATEPLRFWVDPRDEERAQAVRAVLVAAGAPLASGERPPQDAIVVMAPLGFDATHRSASGGFDPSRAVAIDALLPIEPARTRRRVLMGTPVVRPEVLAAACRAFAADGAAVSVIADSPGFVVQRTLAMIAATAFDMGQQRIGTPEDIDEAVRLGLGYPAGPFEWAARIGARQLDEVLAGLRHCFGDDRYRPSLALRRSALLGVDARVWMVRP